MMLMRRI
jgi:hypothetical protein